MTKQNRALKVIDKNSLPKVLEILEIPKAKESRESQVANQSNQSLSIPQRERRGGSFASSKTPKTSNRGGNRNVTTRRHRAPDRRPPKPKSKQTNSTQKKRSSVGSSILSPFYSQVVRRQIRKTIEPALTPSRSEKFSAQGHYNRLQSISYGLNNRYAKQRHEPRRAKSLFGKTEKVVSSEQKLTGNDNFTPRSSPRVPSKGRNIGNITSEAKSVEKRSEFRDDNDKEKDYANDDMLSF